MDFLTLAEKRFSVRKFSDRPVESDKLELILKAGRAAPTAKNFQPQSIYVIQSAEALEKLNRCSPCVYGAPSALLVCYDKNVSWKRHYDGKDHGDIDASIVLTHMMLQAEELGLGSVWVCVFDPVAIAAEFGLPDNLVPSSLMPLGYAADDAEPAPMHAQRKPVSETACYL